MKQPKPVHSEVRWDEKRFRDLLTHLPVGFYRTTPGGRILDANPNLAKMLGYSIAELKRHQVADLYQDKTQRARFLEAYEKHRVDYAEFKLRRKDGRAIWARDYSHPVKGRGGRIECYDGIIVDISRMKTAEERLKKAYSRLRLQARERKQMIKKLENLSITDELTGIFNRRGFRMFAQQHLSLAARKSGPTFLLYIDLDDLKRINDIFGHHVGDQALIRLATILKGSFRSSDIKGRMGGDEFAIFPIDAGPGGIDVVLSRLRTNIDEANKAPDAVFKLGVSVGVAAFDPAHPSAVDELLVRADAMMYEEKRKKEIQ